MDGRCVSNVFANITGWLAFALIINCTVTSYWLYIEPDELYSIPLCNLGSGCRIGLFSLCGPDSRCESTDADWLKASRAFIIIAAILTLVSNIVSVVGFAKSNRQVQFAGAGLGLAASVCSLIGTAIFTAKSQNELLFAGKATFKFGYSLVIAWIVVVLLAASSVLNFTSAKLRKKE